MFKESTSTFKCTDRVQCDNWVLKILEAIDRNSEDQDIIIRHHTFHSISFVGQLKPNLSSNDIPANTTAQNKRQQFQVLMTTKSSNL